MRDYTLKPLKNTTFSYTKKENCSKFSRCNDFRTCPTCANIHKFKTIKKLTEHLEENIIKSYKHKYFIRFKNNDLNISVQEKNALLNLFMNDFIKAKRLKNFVLDNNSQYIFNKEISRSALGYNPHFHMILLSKKSFDINNKKFRELLELHNISFHIEKVYKVKGTYKNSIQSMIYYFNKFDKDLATIQNQTKLLANEKTNRHSNLFRAPQYNKIKAEFFNDFLLILSMYKTIENDNLSRTLYNKIIEEQRELLKEAKRIFKRNTKKTSAKNYLRLLKSLRKKKNLINKRISTAKRIFAKRENSH